MKPAYSTLIVRLAEKGLGWEDVKMILKQDHRIEIDDGLCKAWVWIAVRRMQERERERKDSNRQRIAEGARLAP